jgi:DNA primase
MVVSISKIPDRIQREIYIQECSRIMDISEQVLISTLAQLLQKSTTEVGKKQRRIREIVKVKIRCRRKVDVLYRLERKIIEMLLLYGDKTEEFEDVL